ncbi:hypothetical protein J4209_04840 [Candidatus Woesearchaeota archaeon]|nr:hypothetical protein [Candidatus Woesearchaeota archaeon]
MKQFKNLIKEMNSVLNRIIVFDRIVNAIIIFLVTYLVLGLINFYPVLLSLFPAIIYVGYSYYTNKKMNKAKVVEEKYEALNEKLRTAQDNVDMENPIVDELQREVTEGMKNVKASSFFNIKKTSYKIFACLILGFLIILLTTLNVKFMDFSIIFDKATDYILGKEIGIEGDSDIPSAGIASSEDIYGEESIAVLGNEEVNIEIKPVSFELTGYSEEEAEDKEFEETFPEEVFAESSEGFGESFSIEDQELVKNYFKKLAGG